MSKTRRIIAMVLTVAMVLTAFGMVTVSAASYSDTNGHWAESYIDTWSNNGVIQGDGGYFRPDDAITRAEVAQVTQNVIGYVDKANNTFSDMVPGSWYEDAILRLVAAGALTGNSDGTMEPDLFMTREQAMTMLGRAYGLTVENTQAGITQYSDYQAVSDFATGYVGAMTAAGYVSGYEDGTIRPQDYISRAEFVKILDNVIKLYITAPGTYGPSYIGGIAMIKSSGVVLNGVVGNGAVISPQVAGSVELKDCQFSGNVVNLSNSANVTSNIINSNPTGTTRPNTYYGNGPFTGGGVGGAVGGGSSKVKVTFYWGDNFEENDSVTVTKGSRISSKNIPDPNDYGDENFSGVWYKSKNAAINDNGTSFDPYSQAVTSSLTLYAGRINEPSESAAPSAAPSAAAPAAPSAAASAAPSAAASAAPVESAQPSIQVVSVESSKNFTLNKTGSESKLSVKDDFIFGTPTAAYTDEYKSVFGENGEKAGTSYTTYVGKGHGTVKTSVNLENDGEYKLYLLAKKANTTTTYKVTDKTGKVVIESGEFTNSEQVSENGVDKDCPTVMTSDLGNLPAGEYTIEIMSSDDANKYAADVVSAAVVAIGAAPIESAQPDKEYTVTVASNITGGTVKLVKAAEIQPSAAPAESQAPAASTEPGPVYDVVDPLDDMEGLTFKAITSIMDPVTKVVPAGFTYTDNADITVTGDYEETVYVNKNAEDKPETVTVGGKTFNAYMNIRTNGNDPHKGEYIQFIREEKDEQDNVLAYTYCTPLQITPKKDGKFTIYYRRQSYVQNGENTYTAADGKDIKLCQSNGGSWAAPTAGDMVLDQVDPTASNYASGTQTWDLKAGETYLLWARGTTVTLYGYNFAATTAAAAADEELVDSLKAKAGETITVKAEAAVPGDKITITTSPETAVTAIADKAGYYTFVMPASDTTVNATFGDTAPSAEPSAEPSAGVVLPERKVWKAESLKSYDNANGTTQDDVVVGLGYDFKGRTASYTYEDGTKYSFSKALGGGSGTPGEKLYIAMVPETAACSITVIFDGNGGEGRSQFIKYKDKVAEGKSGSEVSSVTLDLSKADIEANPDEPFYTYGGGSNKNVFGIIIDYFIETPTKYLSGKITNLSGEDLTGKNIVFTNKADATEKYTVPFAETYKVEMPKGKTFDISVEGEENIIVTMTTNTIEIVSGRYDQTHDFEIAKVEPTVVAGTASTIKSHDLRTPVYPYDSAIGAKITFTKHVEGEKASAATEPVTAEVKADGTFEATLLSNETYDVTLTEGAGYTLSPLSTTYTLYAGTKNPYKNILLMKDVADKTEYKAEITVGADKDYTTIREAIAAARLMERETPQTQPITITIDAGTYEEQLYVDIDNVVLKGADLANRPLIQWYYGIGYVYYSADESGWYSADNAVAKAEKRTVSNWGATLRTTNNIKGFRAEDIDFISTFNKKIVQAELDDGVEPGGGSKKDFARTSVSTEVRSKAATERAAAIYAGGSDIELYHCSFSSSQDTFGTNATSMYVKECDISGNTDYICGGNNCYFENCNLIWTGYSDAANGGYITACKTSAEPPANLGYYFKDCTVKYSGESGMKFTAGDWGRNWGGKNCQTIFDNTTIAKGVEKPGKWGNMGGDPTKMSVLYVVNGVYNEGSTTDLTDSDDNPRGTIENNNYTLPEPTDFFGDWTPVHYVSDSSLIDINQADTVNGSFTTSVDGKNVEKAAEGAVVTVAATAVSGYELDTISVAKTAGGEAVELEADGVSFKMPAEAVTVTVTFKALPQDVIDTYSPWQQGQDKGYTDGSMQVVAYQDKYALNITDRNAYYVFDTAVESGTVNFDFDLYVDTAIDRNFRVRLENAESVELDEANVFAEVVNNIGSQVNKGPAIKADNNPLFTYAQLGASGWVHFNIVIDYSKKDAADFITVTATKEGETNPLATATMGAIASTNTALKSIRLVKTAVPVYFANMKITQQ